MNDIALIQSNQFLKLVVVPFINVFISNKV